MGSSLRRMHWLLPGAVPGARGPISRGGLALLAVFALFAAARCSSPKVIMSASSRGSVVRFVYYGSSGSGVLKCKVGSDGFLERCQDQKLVFSEKKALD